jgi:hypothetical protein
MGNRRAEELRRENERLARERAHLERRAARLERERKLLGQFVERLSLERRVADVEVLQQHTDEYGQVLQTVVRLTEMDRQGRPLASQTFGVPGRMPHFDALVIKFKDDYVARGDALRGRSLALFRRVYGETQPPEDGYWLGRPGDVPSIYRVDPEPSEFEVELWDEFWSYAKDPARADAAGVRVAQGEAVYAPMSPGERWRLTLESDGGLNLIKEREVSAGPLGFGPKGGLPPEYGAAGESGGRLRTPSPLGGKEATP